MLIFLGKVAYKGLRDLRQELLAVRICVAILIPRVFSTPATADGAAARTSSRIRWWTNWRATRAARAGGRPGSSHSNRDPPNNSSGRSRKTLAMTRWLHIALHRSISRRYRWEQENATFSNLFPCRVTPRLPRQRSCQQIVVISRRHEEARCVTATLRRREINRLRWVASKFEAGGTSLRKRTGVLLWAL